MKTGFRFTVFSSTILFSACQTQNPYRGEPIPLAQALTAISDGMREADAASRGKKSTGLIPSKATVAFNIVNTEKTSQGITLSVVPVAGLTAGGALGREYTRQGTSAITVEYSSVLLTSKDSIVGSRPVAESGKLLDGLRNEVTMLRKKTELLANKNAELLEKLDHKNKETDP